MRVKDADSLESITKVLSALTAVIAASQNIQSYPIPALIVVTALVLYFLAHRYKRKPAVLWIGAAGLIVVSVGCYIVPRLVIPRTPTREVGTPKAVSAKSKITIEEPGNDSRVSGYHVVRGHVKNGHLAVYVFQFHQEEYERGFAIFPCAHVSTDGTWDRGIWFDPTDIHNDIASHEFELHALGVEPGSKLDKTLESYGSMTPTDYKNKIAALPTGSYVESNTVRVRLSR